MPPPPQPARVFPRYLAIWWWAATLLAAPFFFRMLYEQTFLTWNRGEQALGFTMAHQFAIVLLAGLLGYFASIVWFLFALGYIAQRRRLPRGRELAYVLLTLVGAAVALVPYSTWAALGGVSVK